MTKTKMGFGVLCVWILAGPACTGFIGAIGAGEGIEKWCCSEQTQEQNNGGKYYSSPHAKECFKRNDNNTYYVDPDCKTPEMCWRRDKNNSFYLDEACMNKARRYQKETINTDCYSRCNKTYYSCLTSKNESGAQSPQCDKPLQTCFDQCSNARYLESYD